MRTVGIFIVVLMLFPSFQLQKTMEIENIPADQQENVFHFQITPDKYPSFITETKKKADTDTNKLKKSGWYADAIKQIEESEYEIKPAEKSNEFASPNRQQNLRAFYTSDKFILEPREKDDWKLQLTLKGVYSGKKKIYSLQQDVIATTDKNKIQFNHNNEFTVEYINSKEGVRQNFIIQKPPAEQLLTINLKLQTNKGWFINKVHPKEIHFAKANGNSIEKKLTYNDLKVWDATNKELEASFIVIKNEISINVNTTGAVYPITIDPLSTTPNIILDDCDQADANFGVSVASAGDVNGDGYSDVIIGAYSYDDNFADEGKAFVYHGSATGLSSTPNSTPDDADQADANFGGIVRTAGDVNGDGYSDVIIGAARYDDGVNSDEGWVFVYYGSASGLSASPSTILDDANQGDASFGISVASAGDINADGYSDVIIGASYYDDGGNPNEGRAFVYHGSSSGLSASPDTILDDADQAFEYFGVSVASAGDVNGDGYSDVIIGADNYDEGANTTEGRAFVYHGSSSGLSTIPNSILDDANQAFAYFGISVSSAGDVNGDGYSDVIIGAYHYDDGANTVEGRAFVYHGSAGGLSASPDNILDDADQTNAFFGVSVACAGDVNGDGYSDVIIGAFAYDDGASGDEGRAFIYLGSATGLSATPIYTPDDADQANAQFGISVASAGDVNGDGYSDVIIGANGYDDGANTDEGFAFVYHGGPDGLSASPVNTPDDAGQVNAQFGVSVASAGDVNADGYSDVIIGAWRYTDGGNTDEGWAFVYHGSAAGLSVTPNSILDDADQAGAYFAETVASAGDVNGDGYGDVIIGADNYDDGFADEGRAFVYHGGPAGLSATPNSTPDDADQAFAYFGVSVASAGDVNGDGYGDVIVGAIGITDGANANEGRAYVYHGSATGLSATPNSTPDDANQAGVYFGWSVAGAGDVNGDGYSDVIIGALLYDDSFTDEGKVFVYHGSATGLALTPNSTPDDADQASAQFGECVAAAGDVNGDGFSDVIIGAKLYDDGFADEGRAFVYYGSSTGLSTTPGSTPDDANQASAHFGISVASAGDVNGDGYSDVIIGARYYDDGFTDEGKAFVYYGSPTGLSTTPDSTPDDADQAAAYFGYSVASAGDVNGDGYSDVIIGAYLYDDGGNTNEGRAYVYYGNNTGGLRNNLRLYNSDLVTPIQQSNMNDPNLFGAGLYAKSFIGRQKGRLVWETVKNGQPFSGTPITNSTSYTAQTGIDSIIDLTGKELKHQIAKQIPAKATYIRTRVRYDLITAITGQVYSPWRYPDGYLRGRRDIGAVILPVRFISFNALKQDKHALLKWITVDEEPGVQFEVQHSSDGINFTRLTIINGKNQLQNEYEWLHVNPSKGNNFYRIRAVENQKEAYTATRKLNFSESTGISVYPNPAIADQLFTIKNASIAAGGRFNISFINSIGQLVWQKEIVAAVGGSYTLNFPAIPEGAYLLLIKAENWSGSKKIIVSDP